jgi:ubiquinone/menaquinone biosynthesis C-methylase UbiE
MNRFLARQLAQPGVVLGPIVLGPLWNRRNAALNDAAFDALRLRATERVLEVGFGGGYLLKRICAEVREGLVAGVDASKAMVDFVGRRERERIADGRLILKCAPAEQLPFPNATFSHICSVNSVFYWQDPEKALAEMKRVAAVGARLVVCFTDRGSLATKRFAGYGLRLYSAEELEGIIEKAGFRLERRQAGRDRHRQFWCLVACC